METVYFIFSPRYLLENNDLDDLQLKYFILGFQSDFL